MVPQIKNPTKIVQEISHTTAEQALGVSQINNSIQHLNNENQKSAVTSEELSANSSELFIKSEKLKELIDYFDSSIYYS